MKRQYTDEQLIGFLTQAQERSFQRLHEEYSQEVLAHFRAKREKNEEEKKQIETVPS
jgi:hypothetical protein